MKLYPTSNHAVVYAILVTLPLAGIFTAILFYEWFGNDSHLADATLIASYYACGYSTLVLGWKLIHLCLLRKFTYAKTRLFVILKALAANLLVYTAYFLIRFFFGH